MRARDLPPMRTAAIPGEPAKAGPKEIPGEPVKAGAQNVGAGNTRGVQYAFEIKAVSEILEAIEQRLVRLRSCGGGGAFQCAAYVLAADQATARMGASMYASLLKGDMEASDITYLNVWQDPVRSGFLPDI